MFFALAAFGSPSTDKIHSGTHFLAQLAPQFIWKVFLHMSLSICDASLHDSMSYCAPSKLTGFAQGVMISFRACAAIVSSTACALLYRHVHPSIAFVMLGMASFGVVVLALVPELNKVRKRKVEFNTTSESETENLLNQPPPDSARL